MATISKRPSGSYQAKIYMGVENGKKKFIYFTAKTKKEATAKARELEVIRDNRQHNNLTVREAIQNYIDNKSAILSPSTIRTYNIILNKKLVGLMNKKILTLTDNDVQLEINKEALASSPKTVRNVYGLLSAALKVYNITFNIKLPQKIKPTMFIPEEDDINKLLDLVRSTELYIPVLIACTMGCRRSEICCLEWADVDFKNKMLSINKALVEDEIGNFVQKTTKTTSSTRVIPIPDSVVEVLEEHKKSSTTAKVVNLTPRVLTKRFIYIVKKNFDKPFTFHALRHYYASTLMNLGLSNKISQKLMGHSTDNMLKNVYQHLFDKNEKEAHETVRNYFNKTT